ncbi:hypothetical protein HS088_TW15G00897 [Tripterygium wilfordii]|uniref:Replication factor A C-terminal domain-containing protein n=1 Tax=Tripterygium wilfordii TaxID=458696 RepID=A0A7J7CMR5_TRIWF|nr:hypothetical protein HS088_TW15G00897 [Tripterygium wilfordii]
MDSTPLAELHIGQRNYKITCRVTKIWDATNPTMQDQLMSVDFMLVDNQAMAIQGSIRKEDAARMKELIKEGQIYTFSNFIVTAAKKNFRVCHHKLMIRLGTWSIIKEIMDHQLHIPNHSFSLIDDKELESRLYNDMYLTDIVGHLTSVTKVSYAYVNGRNVTKKNLIIQTLSMKDIPVTLWGTNAEGFDEKNVIDLARKEPLIAVLTTMTIRAFKGETTLSSTSATRIYLNLDTEDVHAFRSRLAYPLEVTTLAQSPEDKQSHVNAAISSRKTIYELLRLDRFADLGKKFICEATIKEIDTSRGWWYNACSKCKVGVTNYDGILSCRKCGPIESLPIPWYKLDAIAADDSGEAHFFMFGKHVEKLVKVLATQLSNLPSSNRIVVPPIIEQICGQKYTFTVSINEREITMPDLTFNISQVIKETPPDQHSSPLL